LEPLEHDDQAAGAADDPGRGVEPGEHRYDRGRDDLYHLELAVPALVVGGLAVRTSRFGARAGPGSTLRGGARCSVSTALASCQGPPGGCAVTRPGGAGWRCQSGSMFSVVTPPPMGRRRGRSCRLSSRGICGLMATRSATSAHLVCPPSATRSQHARAFMGSSRLHAGWHPLVVQTRRATGGEPGARIVYLSGSGDRCPVWGPLSGPGKRVRFGQRGEHPVRRGADDSDGGVSPTDRGRARSARRSRASRTSWSRSGPAGRLR
jgi:hypothetical protein